MKYKYDFNLLTEVKSIYIIISRMRDVGLIPTPNAKINWLMAMAE